MVRGSTKVEPYEELLQKGNTMRSAWIFALVVLIMGSSSVGLFGQTNPPAQPVAELADPAGAVPAKPNWLVDKWRAGGPTMWPLLALSVAGFTYMMEGTFTLRRRRFINPKLADKVEALWKAKRYDEIMEAARKDRSAQARIMEALVTERDGSDEDLKMLVQDVGSWEVRRQLQRSYPLAVVATLAPLLGLLGTVSGMISAFDIVALAGSLGNAALLADSISEALVTTFAGLVIAIPALGAYHLYRSRTLQVGLLLEEEASRMLRAWLRGRGSAT